MLGIPNTSTFIIYQSDLLVRNRELGGVGWRGSCENSTVTLRQPIGSYILEDCLGRAVRQTVTDELRWAGR